jgi:hypothetical protein
MGAMGRTGRPEINAQVIGAIHSIGGRDGEHGIVQQSYHSDRIRLWNWPDVDGWGPKTGRIERELIGRRFAQSTRRRTAPSWRQRLHPGGSGSIRDSMAKSNLGP